jgi:hypothetical protein
MRMVQNLAEAIAKPFTKQKTRPRKACVEKLRVGNDGLGLDHTRRRVLRLRPKVLTGTNATELCPIRLERLNEDHGA